MWGDQSVGKKQAERAEKETTLEFGDESRRVMNEVTRRTHTHTHTHARAIVRAARLVMTWGGEVAGNDGLPLREGRSPTLRRPQKCLQCRRDATQGCPRAARRHDANGAAAVAGPTSPARGDASDVDEGRPRRLRRHVMSFESESSDWAFWLTTHLRMCFSSVLGTEKGMSQKRHR